MSGFQVKTLTCRFGIGGSGALRYPLGGILGELEYHPGVVRQHFWAFSALAWSRLFSNLLENTPMRCIGKKKPRFSSPMVQDHILLHH